ncbi:MAG: carbamoyltransferase [Armatimonadetes bacterium]|nr:carbamoyltransferase [Armatimonadota bacterium]
MYILGISSYYHDACAALIKDGQIIAAADEERFTRLKHDYNFPIQAIDFCLKEAKIESKNLDYGVFYEKPFLKFERILMTILAKLPQTLGVFRESMLSWLTDKIWVKSHIKEKLNIPEEKIFFSEHHYSHAASSFFTSPFKESAILTIDGVGEWTTAALGIGKDLEINLFREIKFPHSLGLLYSAFTAFLGFEVNEGEYKVMGMAPYGKPKYVEKVYKLIELKEDGSFNLNLDYFSYHYSKVKTFNANFEKLFGNPVLPSFSNEIKEYYCDIASSIQKVAEDILIKMANFLYKETEMENLCMAGGVALNSAANFKILNQTPFKNIYIIPACGDSGGAAGAAFYLYHQILKHPRVFIMEHAYWGKAYSNLEIKDFLDLKGINYQNFSDDEVLLTKIAEALNKGKVIGWFQGKFEYGPRALGNRSILADARKKEMKEIVNKKIKFREPFRPFAPSVLEDKAEEFFEIEEACLHYPLRYMLYVVAVKEDKKEIIPAVTHIDGTARIQTVNKKFNPRYYNLIYKFYEITGVPVILNTSFNLKGEPIVNTPENAYNTFCKSDMDLLVLENFLIAKEEK